MSDRGPTRGTPRIGPEALILILITLLAAALRFATLTSQSYWLDEAQAVHELRLSLGGMLSAWSSYEWNPPLYLLIAWPWAKAFGTGEFALRSFSALLGIGLVPLVYLIGEELVSRRAGLVTALFAAVNPFMIWYAQEAREYVLLVVLCAGSILFWARGWRTRSQRDLIGWALLSALALLTQYFAGFLVAAEGLVLLHRYRSRASAIALGAMAVIELALLPHVLPRLEHPAQFIARVPLSLRIQQIPVAFAANTLDRSSAVSYGLIGAAAVAAVAIALLVAGAGRRELRGAGLAAGLAATVILVPLGLALVGHDDYIARGLMPAWVPLAVVLAAACTARRAWVAGAVFALVLVAGFALAELKIATDAAYEKPNWRRIAATLGPSPGGARAIVAYDGVFAAGPLSVYLAGVPWSGPGLVSDNAPVAVSEVDVVGSAADQLGKLGSDERLIATSTVDGYRIVRVGLAQPWRLTPAAIGVRAASLLGPGPSGASVMIQRPGA